MKPLETAAADPLAGHGSSIELLRETGAYFHGRGWSLGTSSNYSIVPGREPLELLVTASGRDKGHLARGDFVRVDATGQPVGSAEKSSAETLLHLVAASLPDVGAVLHTHSVWSTVLSDVFFPAGGFEIDGYEMLKGFRGVTTHETRLWVPIFENTQDMNHLAAQVRERMADEHRPIRFGYLIHRHGLYTWGRDLAEARRHIEIWEFLLECVARRLSFEPGSRSPSPPTTTLLRS